MCVEVPSESPSYRLWCVPIRLMCRALVVSPVGYYAWRTRPEPVRGAVTRGRAAKIQVIHRKSRETYGSPSIWGALVKQGRPVCEHGIARLMRTEGIRTKTVKQWRATTQLNHRMPVAASTRVRQFSVTRPNRVWAGDRTSVWTTESWRALSQLSSISLPAPRSAGCCTTRIGAASMPPRHTSNCSRHRG